MKPKKWFRPEALIVACALLALAILLLPRGAMTSVQRMPRWLWEDAKLRLSLRTDASAGTYYDRTASGPLPFAAIVADMQRAWPGTSYSLVHLSALEVATDLLHRRDIEVVEKIDGAFRAMQLPPWAVREKLRQEVMSSKDFFRDSDRFVFRRK